VICPTQAWHFSVTEVDGAVSRGLTLAFDERAGIATTINALTLKAHKAVRAP